MSTKNLPLMELQTDADLEISVEAGNQTENAETPPPQNRKQFILRVFSISACLIIICLFIDVYMFIYWRNLLTVIQTLCLQVVWFILANLFYYLQQKSPWNWILLSIYTVISALLVSSNLSFFELPLITAAFISTILASIVSILYGIYTKIDYTNFCELACLFNFASVMCWFMLHIAAAFEFNIPGFYRNYCALNLFLRMFMLFFDVQRIMGKMGLKFHEDAIFPAILTIFIGTLQLFTFVLASMGGFGSGNILNILLNYFLLPLPPDLLMMGLNDN